MIKPVNPRHHIIVYMPLRLLMFLIKKKILHQWLTYVIREQTGLRTAPEIVRFLVCHKENTFSGLFPWSYTVEGSDFWLDVDRKWRNSIWK
jgi:hypothetical protein